MTAALRIFGIVLLLAACTPRATLVVTTDTGVGKPYTIRVGSTRELDPADKNQLYTLRGPLSFQAFDVSVPPNREPGTVEYFTRGEPDPNTQFLATGARTFKTEAQFRNDLAAAYRKFPKANRGAVVFVHGYNTSVGDAVFRLTQLTNDLEIDDIPLSYTWPSRVNPLAYGYDRDSALYSRDGLEKYLTEIADSGTRSITLLGHSMGSLIVMETLRQMAIRDDRKVLPKLNGVILMSPDLDVDLFRSQAKRIGTLPQPFIIFTSRRDKALLLAARLTGEPARLGNIPDVSPLSDLDVTVVDVTDFNGDALDHFTPANSPALLKILGKLGSVQAALNTDASNKTGLLPGTVLTVQNATSIILSPVTALAGN